MHDERGFALVVTVTLTAFLVMVLVALALLVRVESAVADVALKQTQARQNALMALNVAVGQLQRYAGHDYQISGQANLASASVGQPWLTGVWNAGDPGNGAVTWLVSGNETNPTQITPVATWDRAAEQPEVALILDAAGAVMNGPGTPEPNRVRLVGPGSAVTAGTGLTNGAVVVPGVALTAAVPGFTAPRTVGRYAFWVGDEGVKASLVLPDRSGEIDYEPWVSSGAGGGEQRTRIHQQLATQPAFFRNVVGTKSGFDPLSAANVGVLARVIAPEQQEWLTPAADEVDLSATRRETFHGLTATTWSVLANTLPDGTAGRGLLRDLSMAPQALGPAFQAAMDYPSYMEPPDNRVGPVPEIESVESERRRYRMTAPVVSAASGDVPAMEFKVAPVLASFLMQFRVWRQSASSPVAIRMRMFTELWNPYSSALVPEDLTLQIEGLPTITISDPDSGGFASVDLNTAGSPLDGGGGGGGSSHPPFHGQRADGSGFVVAGAYLCVDDPDGEWRACRA